MLFNSYLFIFIFLPLTLLVFRRLAQEPNPAMAKSWLTLCSLAFYGWAGMQWLPLLIASTSVNYLLARQIEQHTKNLAQKIWLMTGITANIGLLIYFKYSGELIFAFNLFFDQTLAISDRILPLALSFFSFHQIAYLVDVQQGRIRSEKNYLSYLLFVSFFPHLIAGPIIYYRDFQPQLVKRLCIRADSDNIRVGLLLFSIGLIKKTWVADPIGAWVDNAFEHSHRLNQGEALIAIYLFGAQLYFDFSAYCDMALGLARLFNIHFPLNFNSPYQSKNLQEFWGRWHITLGKFFRDYVYIPLGGNQVGFWRQQGNLLLVMVLSGLWHGSNWLFFLWGLWHGLGMLILHVWRKAGFRLFPGAAQFLTLNFWVLSLGLFRSTSWNQANQIYSSSLGLGSEGWWLNKANFIADSTGFYWLLMSRLSSDSFTTLWILSSLIGAYLICLLCPNASQISDRYARSPHYWTLLGIIFFLGLFMVSEHTPFIYFQF